MTRELRKVQALRDDIWTDIQFTDLKRGDIFRMFDPPDNTPVVGVEGGTEFLATSEVIVKDGVNSIRVQAGGEVHV